MRSPIVVALCAAAVACAHPSSSGVPAPTDEANRARHVLNRLTFGPRPGDLAVVERMGVDRWIDLQLHPERIPDPRADAALAPLEVSHKTAFELAADHPQPNEYGYIGGVLPDTAALRRRAAGDSMNAPMTAAELDAQMAVAVRRMAQIPELLRLRTQAGRELLPAIAIRATTSDRQLLEVMTVFWENHFSVSNQKVPNLFTLVDYDRAIRAHALGKFRDLLGAVAASPAMLTYLDNVGSVVDSLHPTQLEWRVQQRRLASKPLGDSTLAFTVKRRRTGLNENYARELMELHTMGVDGGYTQQDVQEVARCLTGWSIDNLAFGASFSFQDQFHDAGEKTVLGVKIPGGRGVEDGQQVLDILARHPSTAHFIARKLVTHFVSDDPPPALVERVAQTYLRTDGDIRELLRTIVFSPEFNSAPAYRAKVKTPFELVASIARAMDAAPDTTQRTVQIMAQLGQPMFGRVTPDGWPDQASAWINAGALLNRVNLATRVGNNGFPNVAPLKWIAAHVPATAPVEQLPDLVIDAVLAGDASAATRDALRRVAPPAAPVTPAKRNGYVGMLVGVALGSSDFQRR